MTSHIYVLKFEEQDAVKIGKADKLEPRLRDLTQEWGSLNPQQVWYSEHEQVFKDEHALHKRFEMFKKEMPYGDGYTEFFTTDVLKQMNTDNLHRIPKEMIEDLNRKARNREKPNMQNQTNVYFTLTEDETKRLLEQIPDSIDKSLTVGEQLKQYVLGFNS